jgi:hypothetical protein
MRHRSGRFAVSDKPDLDMVARVLSLETGTPVPQGLPRHRLVIERLAPAVHL